MIIDIKQETLTKINNPYFLADAERYLHIFNEFKDSISKTGMEIDARSYSVDVQDKITQLQQKGAHVRNTDKSIYINNISPACVACQTGVGAETGYISLLCNRDCYYCFNENQQDYDIFTESKTNYIQYINRAHQLFGNLVSVGLTGGEPLLFMEDTIKYFTHVGKIAPDAYTRLYTCGDDISKEVLESLQTVNLDEIRFSIKVESNNWRNSFGQIALAKEYIPHVMVEMPVEPNLEDTMKELLTELNSLEIFGINLLEFLYPFRNEDEYIKRGYKIKNRPYRILYDYLYAGGLPISGSDLACLNLMDFCIDQAMTMGVHYCSLENKFSSQIYQQNSDVQLSSIEFLSEKDYFIKTAKVYGEGIEEVTQVFHNQGYQDYEINLENHFIEFHVKKISALKELDLEIGISTSVVDSDERGRFVRELKVDFTTPALFDFTMDL